MTTRLLILTAGIAAVTCFGAVPPISVGLNPNSGTTTQHSYQSDFGAWFVADLADPVTPAPFLVGTDTTAGSWTLQLGFSPQPPEVRSGDTFLLQSSLKYTGGSFALDNWAQELLTANWQWGEGTIFNTASAEPLSGLQFIQSGNRLEFTFNSLPAGTDFLVVNELRYIGPDGAAQFPLSIQSSVVPEPGTIALMALGCAAFLASGFSRREGNRVKASK